MSTPERSVSARLAELAAQLTRSLRASAALLQQLQDGLAARRTAWIAARPGALAAPALVLEPLVQALAAEAGRRDDLVLALRPLLPPVPGVRASARKVDVTRLSACLPAAAALPLRQAAAAATEQSRRVRVELALGARLLQFSRRAHEALLDRLGAARDDVGGYDRSARRVHGALVGPTAAAGTLIDGRM